MFRHVVMFRFKAEASADQISALGVGLGGLPGVIPEILDYRFGPDAGVNDGNFDFVVTADFADRAGYLVYRDHPEHNRVIVDLVVPVLSERAAVQFEL